MFSGTRRQVISLQPENPASGEKPDIPQYFQPQSAAQPFLANSDYTAFGETYSPTTSETIAQRYTYTSQERNPVSGSMFYNYRTYLPGLGRFASKDPIGYDEVDMSLVVFKADLSRYYLFTPNKIESNRISLYLYVKNQPASFIDPYGLCKKKKEKTPGSVITCLPKCAATVSFIKIKPFKTTGDGLGSGVHVYDVEHCKCKVDWVKSCAWCDGSTKDGDPATGWCSATQTQEFTTSAWSDDTIMHAIAANDVKGVNAAIGQCKAACKNNPPAQPAWCSNTKP